MKMLFVCKHRLRYSRELRSLNPTEPLGVTKSYRTVGVTFKVWNVINASFRNVVGLLYGMRHLLWCTLGILRQFPYLKNAQSRRIKTVFLLIPLRKTASLNPTKPSGLSLCSPIWKVLMLWFFRFYGFCERFSNKKTSTSGWSPSVWCNLTRHPVLKMVVFHCLFMLHAISYGRA